MDLLIVFGAMALLVRVGQALYATGLSRAKNAAGTATRSLFDVCVSILAFGAIGAAIYLQRTGGFLAVRPSLIACWRVPPGLAGPVFFYASAVLVATGVIVGTLAERSRFFPAAMLGVLLAGLIVPVTGQWASNGWLKQLGYIDLAGASFLHVVAGVCAALGAILVGPREGKYHRDGSASMIPGHNVPLATAGVLLALVGWFPYVLGFAVIGQAPFGTVALNVLLSTAAGGCAAVLLGRIRYGKPDITLSLLGTFGALVAITAGAGRVNPPAAVAMGAIAGILVPLTSVYIDLIARIDDPTGGISIHAVGGVWGTIAAGIFGSGSLSQHVKQLGIQLAGVAAIVVFAAVLSMIVLYAMRATVGLRVREADEFDGLDLAEHDIGAYPDFQQTMIKSYHLREA